eukprot:scaffold2290_cov56-Cylindrotheca_fusiformis.AAC.1
MDECKLISFFIPLYAPEEGISKSSFKLHQLSEARMLLLQQSSVGDSWRRECSDILLHTRSKF